MREFLANPTVYSVLHLIFLFFLYSLIGWAAEVAFAAVTTRQIVNRGFLNGPICPIYGVGMALMILVLGQFSTPAPGREHPLYVRVIAVFFGGMIITTLVELVAGYILYKAFHTRWWDYSMYKGNLGGYICPQFSLLWGVGSVVLMLVIHPLINRPTGHIPAWILLIADAVLLVLFAVDLIASVLEAVGLSRHLSRIDEMRAELRRTSDALTDAIGGSAMTIDTLLDEQRLQLMLGAMEGRDNAAEWRAQLTDMSARAKDLRDATKRMERQRYLGTGRLLRAFPNMVPDRHEAMDTLRDALNRLADAARQAVADNVEDWKENHK